MAKQKKNEFGMSFEVDLPEGLTRKDRLNIADRIIEEIFDRTTRRNIDKSGIRFPGYSKSYIDSLDFRIAKKAGKSEDKVDLQLSGDMLAALQLLRDNGDSLVIGFDKNTDENDRAEGNILGTYGQAKSTGKKRDFLGLPKTILESIIKDFA
jgi:hypothetical protein